MIFINLNKEFKTGELVLKPITLNDSNFIHTLFQDPDISKYYIIPKGAKQDYKKLIDYWILDARKTSGMCWIIISNNQACGFIAFEFRDTLNNARISYAIHPHYRKNGIATKAAELVLARLKEEGVSTVEADIDKDNINSEKLIERLGFMTDKHTALIDPEMIKNGDIRIRFLWRKKLEDYNELPFFVIDELTLNKLLNNETVFKIWEEEVSEGSNFGFMAQPARKKTGKFHFMFQTDVTEKLVGISNDDTEIYNIPWELLREEEHKGKKFQVLCGWGDQMTGGGSLQFDCHEIGIEKILFAHLIGTIMSNSPNFFKVEKMKNVIGLEGFKFENGEIYI